ncbi:hypothetical protein OIU76_004285 [Salix suchowensis]|nr:hypothetical protein OIU76_004285 [Salix suchowensis]
MPSILRLHSWYLFTVIPSPEARKNMMRLAQRMIRTFSLNISTSSGQSWTGLSDSYDDTVRITTRKITEPGQPNGVILSAVSTTWLPYPHYQVFDFLRDEHRRSQDGNGHNNSGCLLTVGLQVLASTIPSAKLSLSSVTAINNHLCTTVNQINAALSNGITTAAATTTTSSCLDNGNIEPTAAPKQV